MDQILYIIPAAYAVHPVFRQYSLVIVYFVQYTVQYSRQCPGFIPNSRFCSGFVSFDTFVAIFHEPFVFVNCFLTYHWRQFVTL